jgi:hypothetical protein
MSYWGAEWVVSTGVWLGNLLTSITVGMVLMPGVRQDTESGLIDIPCQALIGTKGQLLRGK